MRLTPHTLLLAQIVAHAATVYYLFAHLTLLNAALVFVTYFFTGCIGMSVTYHRLLTHRSFTAPRWFEVFGTLCATLGLTGSSLSWTATHRRHHSRADRHGDPHSPLVLGYFKAQWLSMYSPLNVGRSPVVGDPLHRLVHRYYFHINAIWGILLYLIGGWWAVLTFWLVPACVLWNAGSLINTVCHTSWCGYKNYSVPDRSVNNPVLGLFMWGEGWHNNHHRHQSRPHIGERPWEIDIGYYIIFCIRKSNA